MKTHSMTRRDFVRIGAGAVAAGAAVKATLLEPPTLAAQAAGGGRKIRFASIGTGIRGCDILRSARQVPTGECVGIADLYDMHQKAGKEACGKDVPTTRDYRKFLDDKTIDAVIVATSDHLHKHIVLDAVAAGKDVYVEKPMSHTVADGEAMLAAVKAGKRILEVGSQRVSSILFKKAAEIYASGKLGEVHYIESYTNRNSPSGAWVYPIAPDFTPESVDWKEFVRDAPPHAFDPVRFFRWRCFSDYGEGLAGDLFVHLLSGFQCITGINAPPTRALSSGSLTHFNDGRDYPDLLATLYEYPNLTLSLHCNQNNQSDEPLIIAGKEATMTLNGNTLTVTPQDTRPQPEGYSLDGWTAELKQQYLAEWHKAHPDEPAKLAGVESYELPREYDDTSDHLANFFHAIETREHVVEDEVFGHHAAIACHMANYSYMHKAVATWDEATKTIKG
jgi:predicted dehydrogenase